MLVLSRKAGEDIIIGDNIVIKVIRIDGKKVRLGLEAPEDIKILRGELERREENDNVTSRPSIRSFLEERPEAVH